VAAKLKERGFQRIRPLAGGFEAWVSAGFEVQGAALGTDLPASA
jgi:rhodanese-related sulfurtransferase